MELKLSKNQAREGWRTQGKDVACRKIIWEKYLSSNFFSTQIPLHNLGREPGQRWNANKHLNNREVGLNVRSDITSDVRSQVRPAGSQTESDLRADIGPNVGLDVGSYVRLVVGSDLGSDVWLNVDWMQDLVSDLKSDQISKNKIELGDCSCWAKKTTLESDKVLCLRI